MSQRCTHVLWRREGDGRANEARSIKVLALINARSQALTREVHNGVAIAKGGDISADLSKVGSGVAKDCQLRSLSFRQLYSNRLDFCRLCPVEPRQCGIRYRARILVECRCSCWFASHGVGPHEHCAQSGLINRKGLSGGVLLLIRHLSRSRLNAGKYALARLPKL
jgi:hypothetical protein